MLPCAAVNAFKPHLAQVADYPYTKLDARVKLDQNESPEDFPPELKARAVERLARVSWNRYPELHAEDVRAAVARHEGWPEAGVVLSPGLEPARPRARARRASSVVDTAPAFSYYRGAAEAAATPYRAVPLGDGFALPVDGAPRRARGARRASSSSRTRTGRRASSSRRPTSSGSARRRARRGALLVVDEAYHAFAGTDARPLARANEHVAVLRTFSKSWALGGVRAGYLLGSPRVATVVDALLPPFRIPVTHRRDPPHRPRDPGYLAPLAARIRAERDRLLAGLARHPRWRPYPSASNFILVRTPDAKAAHRSSTPPASSSVAWTTTPGSRAASAVSVGTREENDLLLAAALDGE